MSTQTMISREQIVQLRALLADLGGDPAELDDEMENSDEDGHGTLAYADTRTELALCSMGEHWAADCWEYDCPAGEG